MSVIILVLLFLSTVTATSRDLIATVIEVTPSQPGLAWDPDPILTYSFLHEANVTDTTGVASKRTAACAGVSSPREAAHRLGRQWHCRYPRTLASGPRPARATTNPRSKSPKWFLCYRGFDTSTTRTTKVSECVGDRDGRGRAGVRGPLVHRARWLHGRELYVANMHTHVSCLADFGCVYVTRRSDQFELAFVRDVKHKDVTFVELPKTTLSVGRVILGTRGVYSHVTDAESNQFILFSSTAHGSVEAARGSHVAIHSRIGADIIVDINHSLYRVTPEGSPRQISQDSPFHVYTPFEELSAFLRDIDWDAKRNVLEADIPVYNIGARSVSKLTANGTLKPIITCPEKVAASFKWDAITFQKTRKHRVVVQYTCDMKTWGLVGQGISAPTIRAHETLKGVHMRGEVIIAPGEDATALYLDHGPPGMPRYTLTAGPSHTLRTSPMAFLHHYSRVHLGRVQDLYEQPFLWSHDDSGHAYLFSGSLKEGDAEQRAIDTSGETAELAAGMTSHRIRDEVEATEKATTSYIVQHRNATIPTLHVHNPSNETLDLVEFYHWMPVNDREFPQREVRHPRDLVRTARDSLRQDKRELDAHEHAHDTECVDGGGVVDHCGVCNGDGRSCLKAPCHVATRKHVGEDVYHAIRVAVPTKRLIFETLKDALETCELHTEIRIHNRVIDEGPIVVRYSRRLHTRHTLRVVGHAHTGSKDVSFVQKSVNRNVVVDTAEHRMVTILGRGHIWDFGERRVHLNQISFDDHLGSGRSDGCEHHHLHLTARHCVVMTFVRFLERNAPCLEKSEVSPVVIFTGHSTQCTNDVTELSISGETHITAPTKVLVRMHAHHIFRMTNIYCGETCTTGCLEIVDSTKGDYEQSAVATVIGFACGNSHQPCLTLQTSGAVLLNDMAFENTPIGLEVDAKRVIDAHNVKVTEESNVGIRIKVHPTKQHDPSDRYNPGSSGRALARRVWFENRRAKHVQLVTDSGEVTEDCDNGCGFPARLSFFHDAGHTREHKSNVHRGTPFTMQERVYGKLELLNLKQADIDSGRYELKIMIMEWCTDTNDLFGQVQPYLANDYLRSGCHRYRIAVGNGREAEYARVMRIYNWQQGEHVSGKPHVVKTAAEGEWYTTGMFFNPTHVHPHHQSTPQNQYHVVYFDIPAIHLATQRGRYGLITVAYDVVDRELGIETQVDRAQKLLEIDPRVMNPSQITSTQIFVVCGDEHEYRARPVTKRQAKYAIGHCYPRPFTHGTDNTVSIYVFIGIGASLVVVVLVFVTLTKHTTKRMYKEREVMLQRYYATHTE